MTIPHIFPHIEKWVIINSNVFPNVNAIVVEGDGDTTLRMGINLFLLRKVITFQKGNSAQNSLLAYGSRSSILLGYD
jgi:hypothetical protein